MEVLLESLEYKQLARRYQPCQSLFSVVANGIFNSDPLANQGP